MKRFNPQMKAALGLFALALAAVAVTAATSHAETRSRAYLHGYNLPSSGLALEGYCPVAYHAVNRPVKGSPKYASEYNGVTYHLVSEDARRAFEADPEKYLPAYGGWCALGIAGGDKFPVDPTNFKIVGGRLMLFLRNPDVDTLSLWNQRNQDELTARADAHWKKIAQ